ncbi:MarR family winged helix-turn-helix transcriptional regulator [Sphaerochaeta sp. PS]|uniref:MarR family winged helix-turn-helix transcriptional regulator n=1 Tax=Sphaerochaeta sp. PS TaxID=3076336 RepID=UPI0028A55385|nr:MarR family winged helix-turn-helix transcriptional regulator [Sphaerochaeta sp. PS]MDT4762653.1 MarR family winged helix-turn-helix transcriptional regulator [Sphaerochaeta sp. PS]
MLTKNAVAMHQSNRRIGMTLKILTNLFSRKIEEGIRKQGQEPITPMQAQILCLFGRTKRTSIPQREIQSEFGIRGSTAANILRLMENNGLITRSPSPTDARQNMVTLTETAHQQHTHNLGFIQEFEQDLQSSLSQEELQQFFTIAEKLKKHLE